MFKSTTITFLLLTVLGSAFAQAPFIEWNVTNNNSNIMNTLEYATGITATTDGGYVMAGQTTENYPYPRLVNVKIDARGGILWKTITGVPYDIASAKVKATPDGGSITIVSQQQEAACNVRPTGSSRNWYDMGLYKMSSTGALQWQACIGSINQDGGADLAVLPNGDFIAVGFSTTVGGNITSNAGSSDMLLTKMTSGGNILWCKSYGTAVAEDAYAVIISSTGACIVAGRRGTDGHVMSVNTETGALNWEATFAGNGTDVLRGITEDAAGNFIFCGTSNSVSGITSTNRGGNDMWVLKTTATGALIWSQTFGSTGADAGASIITDTDGNVIVLGTAAAANNDVPLIRGATDAWIIKLAADGSVIWNRTMGSSGSDGGAAIVKASDGGFLTISSTNALYTSFDITCPKGYLWVAKFGGQQQYLPSGPILWLRADAGITKTGNNITQWADQSGYGNNASAVGGLSNPEFVADNIGKNAAVRFNGAAGLTTIAPGIFNCRNSANVFIVMKKQPSLTDQVVIENITQAPAGSSGFMIKSNVKGAATCSNCIADNGYMARHIMGGVESVNATATGYSEDCYQIVEGRFDGGLNGDEAQLFINGNRIDRGSSGTANGNSLSQYENRPFSIGFTTVAGTKQNFYSGDIAELIVYPAALDDGSRRAVYDSLRKKYFSGNNESLNDVVTGALTPSTGFANDGRWKHSITAAQTSKAMIAVEDKCNELTILNSSVYVDANPIYTAANGMQFLRRHYTIQAAASGRVRLYFRQNEFADFAAGVGGVSSMADLSVVQYQGPAEDGNYDPTNGTNVIDITTIDTGSLYNAKYLEFPASASGEFWIKAKNSVLPLKLNSFMVQQCRRDACLSWITEGEVNVAGFDIEWSADGVHFEKVGYQKSLAANGSRGTYSFTHKNISSGKNFYRIKMIDADAQFTYSGIQFISLAAAESIINVFPNPATTFVQVSLKNGSREEGIESVKIFTVSGACVYSKTCAGNTQKETIQVGNLTSGLYILETMVNHKKHYEKLKIN